jgi:hypothetical protein
MTAMLHCTTSGADGTKFKRKTSAVAPLNFRAFGVFFLGLRPVKSVVKLYSCAMRSFIKEEGCYGDFEQVCDYYEREYQFGAYKSGGKERG